MSRRGIVHVGWWVVAATVLACVGMASWYAPVDPGMGIPQKLVYLHVPAAAAAVVSALATFIAAVAFLWSRSRWLDRLSTAAARFTVLCSVIVLISGMVLGKFFWGYWWTWSPRLTFTLVLCILYAVLVLMRPFLRPWSKRATVCAVFAAVAFLDVPLIYLSVRLLPDVHPTSVPLTPEMRLTLAAWFALFALTGIMLTLVPALPSFRWSGRHSGSVRRI
ncbi:MAG: cytochrome C biogenesis protein CcmC [Leptolyngbya sp. PLA1]|nr:cytochrome C biogenesis protein CcmC [Leptolyngbya sp. PLA1]